MKVFVREGARVVAADISGAEKDTAAEFGASVLPVHCDVTNEADVEAVMRAAVDEFGHLDIVCNVAGLADAMMLADVTTEHYDKLMDVDLRGVLYGVKHGIKTMLEAGNGGVIINWSSLGGLNGSYFTSVYSAAKAGVIAITKAAAVEYGAQGIRANCVCPGFIYTAIERGRREHPGHAREGGAEPRRPARGSRRGRGVPRIGSRVVSCRAPSFRSTAAGPRSLPDLGGAARYVGTRVGRVEDARLLTGRGTYVDDITLPGMLHAYFVRSPHARAAIRGIDASAALALPGVHAVFTAADLNPDVKEQWHTSIGPESPETPRPPLAEDEVRFVGDPVALVVADEPRGCPGRGRPGRGRLRVASRRRRLHRRRARGDVSSTSSTARTSSATSRRCRLRRWPTCSPELRT